ncbi:MAG: hypothetical protein ACRD5K_09640 [Candidatus Acidiferrales bacterium]
MYPHLAGLFMAQVTAAPSAAPSGTAAAIWHVLNSQVLLTLLTVGLGGLLAAWLTAKWQRKSELFKTRIEAIKTLLEQHKELGDALETGEPQGDKQSVYRVNLSLAFLSSLFPGKAERDCVMTYYDALTKTIAEPERDKRVELGRQAGLELRTLMKQLVKRTGITK